MQEEQKIEYYAAGADPAAAAPTRPPPPRPTRPAPASGPAAVLAIYIENVEHATREKTTRDKMADGVGKGIHTLSKAAKAAGALGKKGFGKLFGQKEPGPKPKPAMVPNDSDEPVTPTKPGSGSAGGGAFTAASPEDEHREKQFNPVVELTIVDGNGAARTAGVKTTGRKNCTHPVYRSYFEFEAGNAPFVPGPTDQLQIKLSFDTSLHHTRKFARTATIPLASLTYDGLTKIELHKPLLASNSGTPEPPGDTPPTAEADRLVVPSIYLRKARPPRVTTKRVFLVRHGESEWNEAQHKKQVVGLLNFDHPLNEVGIKQGQELNGCWKSFQRNPAWAASERSRALSTAFLQAEMVCCSPLTRAAQTALLTLQDHPALGAGKALHLKRCLREVRSSLGSLDTVGKYTGPMIRAKLLEKIEAHLGSAATKALAVEVDPGDAESEWWSGGADPTLRVQNRLAEIMRWVKYSKEESMILVGHSLYFRAFCKKYADAAAVGRHNQPLAENMGKHKMCNAGCMALTVDFGGPQARIVDAEMLFGSTLVGVDDDDADSDDDAGAGATGSRKGSLLDCQPAPILS